VLRGGAAGRASAGAPKKGWAIASLILGLLSLPTLGILGIGALLGIIFGIVALVKASQQPDVYGGKGLAISGIVASALSFVMIPFIGIIAAIAIPSLLRARVSANESATIGDLRTVVSAEMAYGSANGGAYDTLECLSTPARCIPNYPATGPAFVDAETVMATRHGYVRTFHAGPPAPRPGPGMRPSSPSSVSSFAYVAVPVAWNRTGTRGFCADSTGQVCSTRDISESMVVDGLCAASCAPLR
jgi:type II secretory pathway pseudopilin PulG